MRIFLFFAFVVVAVAAWDETKNDGKWRQLAEQTVERTVDDLGN